LHIKTKLTSRKLTQDLDILEKEFKKYKEVKQKKKPRQPLKA